MDNDKKSIAVGVDPGTMFFQVAGEDENIKTIRNSFVEISDMDDLEDILRQNGWQYVKDGEHYFPEVAIPIDDTHPGIFFDAGR